LMPCAGRFCLLALRTEQTVGPLASDSPWVTCVAEPQRPLAIDIGQESPNRSVLMDQG
jgi:hypothetical protein